MSNTKTILKPGYLFWFIFRFSLLIFAVSALFGLFITGFLDRMVGPTYLEGLSVLSQLQAYLPRIIFISAIFQALVLCSLIMLLCLFWSQGVSGPLVRFSKNLKIIVQGRSCKEPLSFRATDQLHGLAQAFSELIISRSNTNSKALSLLVEAQKELDQCRALASGGKEGSREFLSKLKGLKDIYQGIKAIYTTDQSGQ